MSTRAHPLLPSGVVRRHRSYRGEQPSQKDTGNLVVEMDFGIRTTVGLETLVATDKDTGMLLSVGAERKVACFLRSPL